MQLEELPIPVPGPAQALVRVHAASVNFLDIQKRRGELVGRRSINMLAGGVNLNFPRFWEVRESEWWRQSVLKSAMSE